MRELMKIALCRGDALESRSPETALGRVGVAKSVIRGGFATTRSRQDLKWEPLSQRSVTLGGARAETREGETR